LREGWRKLIAQPYRITSIGLREWAHVGQNPMTLGISAKKLTTDAGLPLDWRARRAMLEFT
jgi:hypothetical protein